MQNSDCYDSRDGYGYALRGYQSASSSSSAPSRPPGFFGPSPTQTGSEAPQRGGPIAGSRDHLEALLQSLMVDDTSTKDVNDHRHAFEPPCLDELLLMAPAQVGAYEAWAQQVVRALRRPDHESIAPAGMTLEPSPSQVQRRTNAKIMEWILRHGAVYELSQLEHGCWIVQKALEVVDASVALEEPLRQLCRSAEPKTLLAGGFKGNVNRALQDKHANYVLQKCIEVLPRQSTQFILDEIGQQPGGAVLAARSKSGCRVLQRLIEHFWDEKSVSEGLRKIVYELIEEDEKASLVEAGRPATTATNDLSIPRRLVNDPFANFVFQSLLEHHAWDREVVQRVLVRDIHFLAQSFYASHVLSFVLTSSDSQFRDLQRRIIEALKGSDDSPASMRKREKFLKLEKSKMGSFVFKQANLLSPEPVAKGVRKGKSDLGSSSPKGGRKAKWQR